MSRRRFFPSPVTPEEGKPAADRSKLRTIRRWDEKEKRWIVVRMREIRKGDLFMFDDAKPQWIAQEDAELRVGEEIHVAARLHVADERVQVPG